MGDVYIEYHYQNDAIEFGSFGFFDENDARNMKIGQEVEITNPKTLNQDKILITNKYPSAQADTGQKVILVEFKQKPI